MSKEQTPIEKELKDWSPLKFNGEMKWRNEDIIEFTQAKVLEALEKVKEIAWGTGLSKKEYDIFCNDIEKELKQ